MRRCHSPKGLNENSQSLDKGKRTYGIAGVPRCIAVALAIICLLTPDVSQAQTDPTRKILILNSYHKGFEWTDNQVSAGEQVLTTKFKELRLYVDYMDTKRIFNEEYLQLIRRTLALKYDKIKLDAIICTDDNALKLLLKYHKELFGEAPVVFCGINSFEDSMLKGKTLFTGLLEVLDIKATIDLALKLHPGTRRVVVISDGTTTGLGQRREVTSVASQYKDLRFEYLKGEELSSAELVENLRTLPSDSVVLLTVWLRDKTGAYVSTKVGVSLISSNSTVPVYGIFENHVGNGIVGGKLLNSRTHGRTAAEMVLRIVGGEKPADIPVLSESTNPYMFDYDQLERWRINMSDLPEGSIVMNTPFSFYGEYKRLVWGVVAVLAVLLLMVGFLTVNVARRKHAEVALEGSEKKYRDLYDNAPDMFASVDAETAEITECNQTVVQALGYTKEEIIARPIFDLYTPDSAEYAKTNVFPAFVKTGEIDGEELQLQRKDGSAIDVLLKVSAVRDSQGKIMYSRSSWRDIGERKRAEDQIKASLKEKEVLLSEIHHRVKNNMQVISSLLNLQADRVKDKEYADLLKVSRDRIRSMTLIHEKLYQSKDFAKIDFDGYIKSLGNDLFRSYGVDPNRIVLKREIEGISLGLDNAIPCALIINELVSNSLKYAFPDDRGGEVGIDFRSIEGDEVELRVRDNGVGLPDGLDFRNTESLGLHIVNILTEDQLEGKIELDRTQGTNFNIRFKRTQDKVRT